MNVDEFLVKNTLEWGDKKVYSIEKSEVKTLIAFGGEVTESKNHGDGTFSLTIRLRGKDFICITREDTSAT